MKYEHPVPPLPSGLLKWVSDRGQSSSIGQDHGQNGKLDPGPGQQRSGQRWCALSGGCGIGDVCVFVCKKTIYSNDATAS